MPTGSKRGHQRERQVRRHLEEKGWWTCRAAGSLGDADIVALKAGVRPLLVECKSDARGPFNNFGPKDRAELILAAEKAGADILLASWPPRGKLEFIPPSEWP